MVEIDVAKQEHYTKQFIQPIVYMMYTFSIIGFECYLAGNIIKYISRYTSKNGIEDLKKARVYLNWLIEFVEFKQITVSDKIYKYEILK